MTDVSPVITTASAPRVRYPRALAIINGIKVPILRFETEENSFYEADTFRVELPRTIYQASGLALDADELEVEIFAGLAENPNPEDLSTTGLDSIMLGRVDDFDLSFASGVVNLAGRDLTSLLIDSKTEEKYVNLTASGIAVKLADAHGLTPRVTATSKRVGSFYQTDNVQLKSEVTEWDLLTYLAQQEKFVTYVEGRELHFHPRLSELAPAQTITIDASRPYLVAGVEDVTCSRSLTLAKDVKVTVRSWQPKGKKRVVGTATASRRGKGGGRKLEYVFNVPGLTAAQAQDRAEQKLAELTLHQMKLFITGPANNNMKVGDSIELKGSGTLYDQSYYPSTISREMDTEDGGGYFWRIEAKNVFPETEVTI